MSEEQPAASEERIDQLSSSTQTVLRMLIYPLKLLLRFWRFSRIAFILGLLALILCGGVLEYVHLSQPTQNVDQVDAATGRIQWQHALTLPMQTLLVDTQGTIVSIFAGHGQHRLTAFDRQGVPRWTTFASEETFDIPALETQPGAVVVTLGIPATAHSNGIALSYSPLTLYLLDRATGRIRWQYTVVSPAQPRYAVVSGADARSIYITRFATNTALASAGASTQLLAINRVTGRARWHIDYPGDPNASLLDPGILLLEQQEAIWQVGGTVLAIDTSSGRIQWRRFLPDNVPANLAIDEAHMAETDGVLLVERNYVYSALDLATGKVRWNVSDPGPDAPTYPGGVIAAHHMFLIYDGGVLEALDTTSNQLIWSQKELGIIQNASIADDGSLLYIVILNSVDASPPEQVLAALETQSGTVRWTFEPFDQESFMRLQSDGLQYSHHLLFVTLCLSDPQRTCSRTRLYALNGDTGEVRWKIEAMQIADIHVGMSGDVLLFQMHSSAWMDLTGRFRG